MKIKKDFLLRKVSDTYVVVPVGSAIIDFSGLINLNETGAFLFELLQNGAEEKELVDKLLQEYDVSESVAIKDVKAFILKVKEANILEKD